MAGKGQRLKDLVQEDQSSETLERLKKIVSERDATIVKLENELKLKESEIKNLEHHVTELKDLLQTSVQEKSREKRQGISAEPSNDFNHKVELTSLHRYPKNMWVRNHIHKAIRGNDFLCHVDDVQQNEIVDCMYESTFTKDQYIIREGGVGTKLYVISEGEVKVTKKGESRGEIGPGKLFGELALLYNCTRTATITALTNTKVWALDRNAFQAIMMNTGIIRHSENLAFLKAVPELQSLSEKELVKIATIMQEDAYSKGDYIIREGATGDTFYLITSGSVKVTKRNCPDGAELTLRELKKGAHFGERALLGNSLRTANVIAKESVAVLTLDKEDFKSLIGDLVNHEYQTEKPISMSEPDDEDTDEEYLALTLNDFCLVKTLGIGGFGRVELVQLRKDPQKTFALKCLSKQHIVDTHQQNHIFSEKSVMLKGRSPFITRLYCTFRCSKYLYMLLEVCLGGEVWTILRDMESFDETTTRFCCACVVEALQYLHDKDIVYRDLKPENLLLDSRGYVKLVDFGFAKCLGPGEKTWTFCGTPEYVAPETILNKGHDISVDYWSLGILMFELLTGRPPFSTSDPMTTYRKILKGIDAIEFPKKISRSAYYLIKKLCRDNPAERVGYLRGGIKDIKCNRWFEGFDWDGLGKRTLVPPILPLVMGPTDTSNFDDFPPDEEDIPPDDNSGWDSGFGPWQETPNWCFPGGI